MSLISLCLACACADSSARRLRPIEVRDEIGFTITEQVRFSARVKSEFDKGVRLLEDEDYESGIEVLEGVTESAPAATAAYIDLGIAHRLAGDLEQAEQSIEHALELNPRHPAAHNEMGIVHRKSGRFEEARASYERALDVYPDFHYARRNLGILCDVYLGDMACAMEHYELYSQIMPEDETVTMWITDLQNRMGSE